MRIICDVISAQQRWTMWQMLVEWNSSVTSSMTSSEAGYDVMKPTTEWIRDYLYRLVIGGHLINWLITHGFMPDLVASFAAYGKKQVHEADDGMRRECLLPLQLFPCCDAGHFTRSHSLQQLHYTTQSNSDNKECYDIMSRENSGRVEFESSELNSTVNRHNKFFSISTGCKNEPVLQQKITDNIVHQRTVILNNPSCDSSVENINDCRAFSKKASFSNSFRACISIQDNNSSLTMQCSQAPRDTADPGSCSRRPSKQLMARTAAVYSTIKQLDKQLTQAHTQQMRLAAQLTLVTETRQQLHRRLRAEIAARHALQLQLRHVTAQLSAAEQRVTRLMQQVAQCGRRVAHQRRRLRRHVATLRRTSCWQRSRLRRLAEMTARQLQARQLLVVQLQEWKRLAAGQQWQLQAMSAGTARAVERVLEQLNAVNEQNQWLLELDRQSGRQGGGVCGSNDTCLWRPRLLHEMRASARLQCKMSAQWRALARKKHECVFLQLENDWLHRQMLTSNRHRNHQHLSDETSTSMAEALASNPQTSPRLNNMNGPHRGHTISQKVGAISTRKIRHLSNSDPAYNSLTNGDDTWMSGEGLSAQNMFCCLRDTQLCDATNECIVGSSEISNNP